MIIKENLRKVISYVVTLAMIVSVMAGLDFGVVTASAASDAEQCITSLLSEGVTATNCLGGGYFGTFTGGISKGITIDKGVILATRSSSDSCANDSDLAALMNYKYGGDTAILQFDMIASGELLNFNYVFSSKEFNQPPQYNDVFGLFVSVNGGPFENIAKLPNGKDVTITNLRAGADGTQNNNGTTPINTTGTYDYFRYNNTDGYSIDENVEKQYGVSNKFNAQKVVNIGDKVTVKFVIADVTDEHVDSAVYIEAGSLSFNAPGAKLDCKSETISDLEEGTYYVTVTDNGSII